MKVKELIEILDEYPGDHEVILQKDSEGNYYSPCAGAWEGLYLPENTYSGEAFSSEDMEIEPDSVILYPIN